MRSTSPPQVAARHDELERLTPQVEALGGEIQVEGAGRPVELAGAADRSRLGEHRQVREAHDAAAPGHLGLEAVRVHARDPGRRHDGDQPAGVHRLAGAPPDPRRFPDIQIQLAGDLALEVERHIDPRAHHRHRHADGVESQVGDAVEG
ncbi:MAG: hypothetical protein AAGF23_02950 [Acidobacteriota bacterium]